MTASLFGPTSQNATFARSDRTGNHSVGKPSSPINFAGNSNKTAKAENAPVSKRTPVQQKNMSSVTVQTPAFSPQYAEAGKRLNVMA